MLDIILASKSPRRRELLTQLGVKFRCIPAEGEEIIKSTLPREVVKELSSGKALEIEDRIKQDKNIENTQLGDTLIIGADTIVSCQDRILGKPETEENAKEMLSLISGREHQVYTGVSVIYISGNIRKEISFAEKTDVYVRKLTEEDIEEYTETGESMDKAGAYGIQGIFGKFVEKIDGDYNNVVGLPVARMFDEIRRKIGIDITNEKRKVSMAADAVIFDLDGTILDTIESIAHTLNTVLKKNGFRTHSIEDYKVFAGDGQTELVKRALVASGDSELTHFDEILKQYIELFIEGCNYKVKPYDGIVELFEKLKKRNIKIAVFSNKAHTNVTSILDNIFGENFFDAVLGQREGFPKKPDGKGIDILLEEMGIDKEKCLYAGDTSTDMLTGKGYGLFTIGVSWGFRTVEELISHNADIIVNHPLEIIDVIDDRW